MFKNLLFLFFFFLSHFSFAQKIAGVVVNQITQEPLGSAHVFLNNFSKGTNTDAQGRFELSGLQAGTYDLIVSYVGYKTFAQTVKVENDLNLQIELSPQSLVLQEVVIEDDKNWKTYYQTFLRDFLGNTPNSQFCKIKNPDVLRIRYEADSSLLKVQSDEALLIENKVLGYKIKYFLKEYRRYFSQSNNMSYYGFMVFEEMTAKNKRQAKKWAKNRQEAWLGSLQHFLRGVYRKNYEKENFLVQKVLTIPTDRKPEDSIRKALKSLFQQGFNFNSDTIQYWTREQRKPPYQKMLIRQALPPDSISRFEGSQCKLQFSDELQISYMPSKNISKVSQIKLLEKYVFIEPNGILENPLAILMQDYWAWRERVSNLLPYDYQETPTK